MDLVDPPAVHKLFPRIPDLRPPLALEKRLRLRPLPSLRVVHPVRQLVQRRDREEPLLPQYQAHRLGVGRRVARERGQVDVRGQRGVQEGRVQRDGGAEPGDAGGARVGGVDGGAVPGCGQAPRFRREGGGAGHELEGEHGRHLHEEEVHGVVVRFGEGRRGWMHDVPVGRVGDGVARAVEERLPEDLHVEGRGEVGGAEGERGAEGGVFGVGDAGEVGALENGVDRG